MEEYGTYNGQGESIHGDSNNTFDKRFPFVEFVSTPVVFYKTLRLFYVHWTYWHFYLSVRTRCQESRPSLVPACSATGRQLACDARSNTTMQDHRTSVWLSRMRRRIQPPLHRPERVADGKMKRKRVSLRFVGVEEHSWA